MSDPRPFAEPGTPERWVRPRHFCVSHVALEVTVDLAAHAVEGRVEHRVEWLPHGARLDLVELDAVDLEVQGVEVDGRPAQWSRGAGRLAIAVPPGDAPGCTVAVRFRSVNPAKGLAFVDPDPARGEVAMAWTQGAMEDHCHWFPCWDSPNNLSTFAVTVRHRAEHQALSNGERLGRSEHGDGWATTRYRHDRPHVLYLLNLVVGDLVGVEDPACPVPVTHWLPRGREALAPAMFRATGFAIRWLAEFLGHPYPWTRYGHAVVHRFMWGGMENTTLTTITDRVLMSAEEQEREDIDCDRLVIHELVHQWFGDLLTMKGWSDIWLNESFATWLEARCSAAWYASRGEGREADILARLLWDDRRAWLDEDAGRYRRALVTNRWEDAYELFDRVAYEKGGVVLELLCHELGEDRCRAALALYLKRHAHGLVETADWRQAVEDATGEPCDRFFAQWVHRAGHPELKVTHRHDPARGLLLVEVEQTQAVSEAEPAFRLACTLAWAGGHQAVELERQKQLLAIPCAKAPVWVCLDPEGSLPAQWGEEGEQEALLARLADDACPAAGRARAAVLLGRRHPAAVLVEGLAAAAADPLGPELLRSEAIAALGSLRCEAAVAALLALSGKALRPRLRRAVAIALGQARCQPGNAVLAQRLVELADAEKSLLCAGELLAARGAIEHPGATPALRQRWHRSSWNERLRTGCVRGLGACGEAAALDDLLPLLRSRSEPEVVRCAACHATARLAARHLLVRGRVRQALEPLLDDPAMHVRCAAAASLGSLGDPAATGALEGRRGREVFGNVRRNLREAAASLRLASAREEAQAALAKRLEEEETARKRLENRLEALEKRLDAPVAKLRRKPARRRR